MRWTAWIGTWLVVASVSACATARASRLREQRLEAELDGLRYQQPPAEVWQNVRQLLAERGCPLAGADADEVGQSTGVLDGFLSPARETRPYREETGLLQELGMVGPKPDGRPDDGSVSLDTGWRRRQGDRYRVDGLVEPGGFRVIFTRVVKDTYDHPEQRTRDLELELALARRIEPQAAERIERSVGSTGSQ